MLLRSDRIFSRVSPGQAYPQDCFKERLFENRNHQLLPQTVSNSNLHSWTYLLNKSEKTPFRKIGILAKSLLCETSSSTVNKMRGDQALGNIDHFIGGHILFRTKRAYLLNKGEKTPFRKIVIVAKLLLCKIGKNPSFSVNYYFQTHCHSVVLNCVQDTKHFFFLPHIFRFVSFRFLPQNRISRSIHIKFTTDTKIANRINSLHELISVFYQQSNDLHL